MRLFVMLLLATLMWSPVHAEPTHDGPFVATHDLILTFPSGVEGKTLVHLFPDAAGDGPAISKLEWPKPDAKARWARKKGVWYLDGSSTYPSGATLTVHELK